MVVGKRGDFKKIYYDPKQVGSYSGLSALKKQTPQKTKSIKKWLLSQDTYTLHKTPRKHFQRRKTIVSGINDQWQGDLISLQNIKKQNKGYNYIFTVIDVFSKVAYAVPLKSKTGVSIVEGFKKFLKQAKQKPRVLQSDKGPEFLNRNFQNYLKKLNIHFFVTENENIKAAVVERFNRTLKERMYRYFTKHNTLHYLNVLDDLVHSYNNSFHRSIKRTPSSVNKQNQEKVWQTLYGSYKTSKQTEYKVGDSVRISKARKNFSKGYLPSWTEEIFTINKKIKTTPTTYRIVDEQNNSIKGSFYKEELQKVLITKNKLYKIEKILNKRKRGKTLQYFVKWRGYPDSHNSWVPHSQIKRL